MDEYGALVERTDGGIPQYWGENLSQRHFFFSLQKPRGLDWDRTRASV